MFNTVAFIGIGLIAGSMAKDMRRLKLANKFTAIARSQSTIDEALDLGLIDAGSTDYNILKDADLIVLAVPVASMASVMQQASPFIKAGCIITDVGSVKAEVIKAVTPHMPAHAAFIPAHPIAGTEFSGPSAAVGNLFQNRWCILCQESAEIAKLWQALGSKTTVMSAQEHDKILALTSHLPHLIAYSIVGTATHLNDNMQQDVFNLAAGGFRDFTRIAGSDPEMWRDIFLNNKEAVLEMLQRFSEDLSSLQRAIRHDQGDTLFDYFTKTRSIRKGVIEAGQDT